MHSFTIYGKQLVQAHIHTRVQCSHGSVGLTQARPNNNAALRSVNNVIFVHPRETAYHDRVRMR